MTATSRTIVSKFRPIGASGGRWVTPRKGTNDNAGEACVEKEKAEPIVAFSRPPTLPPFLGTLVALSVLESWTKRDSNDD
ncbi:UNVERIFIED_CONTAM: hypothetical protein Slati_1917400 [Sesamum latifolium]|uniref:Uncharacterized protein n=1 Tax=Sesamum latifolium TaxID=2727402 RepID=A0AAW2X1N4_9LAMI